MSRRGPLTPLADTHRRMPEDLRAPRAVAAAAVDSLAVELRRLERQGDERPLARASHQLRYWRFVHALCALAEAEAA